MMYVTVMNVLKQYWKRDHKMAARLDGYQCKLAITRERQRFSKVSTSHNRDIIQLLAILFVPSLWRRSELQFLFDRMNAVNE